MRFHHLLSAIAAAAAAASIPTFAHTEPAPGAQSHDIVVQGDRDPQRRVHAFVSQLTPGSFDDQVGRFLDPVCPRVLGLPGGANALVEGRFRKVAAAIGAPVAPQDCTVDVYVLVGRSKAEIIDGLRKQAPALVNGVKDSVLRRLAESPGPVAAWQILGRIGSDGMPQTTVSTSSGDSVPMASTINWASRISTITRPKFLGSVLVVEANALDKVDTRQLADYAVMRTLAPTDTTRQLRLPAQSILQLFDPGASPEVTAQSVTRWDYAYLKALYSTSNVANAIQQRSEIGSKMSSQLQKDPQ
jgi:hypothetical protein